MFSLRSFASHIWIALVIGLIMAASADAQVKRVVIVKIDGLPGYFVDRFVKQINPETGKSVLPWFDEVFYKNGTRVPNFYTRGMSLSGPSWGQLDTGQHLQLKGNVEYDRFTLHAYDYLNFFPFYMNYGLNKKVDMPAVEVMDQLQIPLLSDAFPFYSKYVSAQLYQRGNEWAVLASGVLKLYPGNTGDFIDEWTMGLDYRGLTVDQAERDITGKVVKRPQLDYYDYYDTQFDHVSHHNNDDASRLVALKEIDKIVGKLWVAIQSSSRADETALVLVSDHGFNAEDKVYSQGFNLVKMLTSAAGGGHHVVTKRRLMLDYSVKGVYPLVPLIKTSSKESYYLDGQSDTFVTALLDFDGNERSSIHLRNSDLNVLQILLQQLQQKKLTSGVRAAAAEAFFQIIDRHKTAWQQTADELDEELGALHRWIVSEQKIMPTLQMTSTKKEHLSREVGERNRRRAALLEIAIKEETDYRKYVSSLRRLLQLKREFFNPSQVKIEDLVPPGAMGDPNTTYQLQNYVVGPAPMGLTLGADNHLDLERSFVRVNYFDLLASQSVRSNVQPKVGNRPVDFVATRIPVANLSNSFSDDLRTATDPIWLSGALGKQALLLSREENGVQSFKYLPISALGQDADGKVTYKTEQWGNGFPLKIYEDENFAIPRPQRDSWLSGWHNEYEWLRATHRCVYSNAVVGLNEQMDPHPISNGSDSGPEDDDRMIRRFRQRQRRLAEADLLILANDHWNFDVRGFNPGGNHGSFFRASTNAIFMIAGGSDTGIPRGLAVEEPYDGLSFTPTILALMGKIDQNNDPTPELYEKGFRHFPGRVVKEIVGERGTAAAK
jgi:Type I phosphodiesterase / nucleotide pyrophosphatase